MDEDDGYGQYEVDNSLLQCYEWDIRDLLQKDQDLDGTDMKDFFFDDDNLQKKMVSCKWDIVDRKDTLYGKVDVRLREPLTSEETTVPLENTTVNVDVTEPTEPIESTEPTAPAEEAKPVIKYQPVYKNSALKVAEFTITAAEDIKTADSTVQYKKGEVVDTVTTGKNGKETSKELYAGKYTVTESKSPYGYLSNGKSITVEITYGGQNVEITNTDIKVNNIRQKAEITLQKVLEKHDLLHTGDNGEITNVDFALFADEDVKAADGKVIPKNGLIEIINCDENGKVQFNTEIPFGK